MNQQHYTYYTLTGHERPLIDLATLFKRFAESVKGTEDAGGADQQPQVIGCGQPDSGLKEHGEKLMYEKEKES